MGKCELVETICRTTALQLRKVELSKYRPHAVCDTSTAHRRKADDLRISAMYGTRTEDAGLSCRSQHWSRHLHSCAMNFIRLMQNAVTVSEFPMPAIMHESVSSHCREFEDGYQKVIRYIRVKMKDGLVADERPAHEKCSHDAVYFSLRTVSRSSG